MSGSVSFKITRESQPPSHSTSRAKQGGYKRYASDSGSDEDDDERAFKRRGNGREAVTSIDRNGVRSANDTPKAKPLTIPSQPNKDFRKAALELRAAKKGLSFLPGANSASGEVSDKNGRKRELTAEELAFLKSGTNVQRIGTGVVTGGIREREVKNRDTSATPTPESGLNGNGDANGLTDVHMQELPQEEVRKESLTEDQLALQELLGANSDESKGPKVHIIPQSEDTYNSGVVSEQDAYAHDVASRPESATLEDYERVPIEDFGAALLRGMGGGKARKATQAYVPKPRTALLGIGAKSREETFGKDFVAAANGGKKENKRDGMRFIPLARVERNGSSGTASPAPLTIDEGSSRWEERGRRRDGKNSEDDKYSKKRSEKEDDYEYKKSKKRRDDDYSSDEERRRRRREREGKRERSKERSSRKDRDRDDDVYQDKKYRERSRSRERRRDDRESDRDREKDRRDRRDRERERERDDDRDRSRRDRERDSDRDRDRRR